MLPRNILITILLLLAALLPACQSPSSQYLMNGIGAGLPAPDMDRAGKLQNAYFNYLCQQAGLVSDPFGSEPGKCQVQAMDSGSWNLIVRQGMNDIDRRCDAYLEWLDNKQRSKGPLLNQVRDVQGAVRGIMFAVDPGSTAAMEIVGLAFGLIDRSLQNYNSRLLDLVEPSTRNSVVLNALRDFRREIKDKRLQFGTRPDAEYALREYMRRCLPFAIEAQINDLSTLGSQGVSPREATTIFESPVASILSDTPRTSRDPIIRTPKNTAGNGGVSGSNNQDGPNLGGITSTEKRFELSEVEELQTNLCTSVSGQFDPSTRNAIEKMQAGIGAPVTGKIEGNTQKAIAFSSPFGCDGYLDAFEKFHFRPGGTGSSAEQIRLFQASLNKCANRLAAFSGGALALPVTTGELKTGALDSATRDLISFVVMHVSTSESVPAGGALTPKNISAINTCSPKQ